MSLPEIDLTFLQSNLVDLLNIPSPTGNCTEAIDFVSTTLSAFPLSLRQNQKGALIADWRREGTAPARGITAHVDTLGAMVKEIKPSGRLKLSRLGGYGWSSVEGEGVTVLSSAGKPVRGSILLTKASQHVHGVAFSDTKREDDTLEVRLDARTRSAEETRALGIQVGDFVALDPRVECHDGFIRSRHLDNKAGVACIAAALKALSDAKMQPTRTLSVLISNYEEVGHGAAAGFPADMDELLCVDMAAVGEGQSSDEFSCSLCVKDSGGPYHHGFSTRLRRLAEAHAIPYKVDIYPYYGSDGEAYWRAGGDVAVALIGPGVDASHNYERTHLDALAATTRWILAWLLAED